MSADLFPVIRGWFARLDPAADPPRVLDAFVSRCSDNLRRIGDQVGQMHYHNLIPDPCEYGRAYLAWGYLIGLHGVYPLPHYHDSRPWYDLPEADRRRLLTDLPALLAVLETEHTRIRIAEALR